MLQGTEIPCSHVIKVSSFLCTALFMITSVERSVALLLFGFKKLQSTGLTCNKTNFTPASPLQMSLDGRKHNEHSTVTLYTTTYETYLPVFF
jgi:hypothetical protein